MSEESVRPRLTLYLPTPYSGRVEETVVKQTSAETGSRFSARREGMFIGLGLLVVAVDQVTKWLVDRNLAVGETGLDLGWIAIVHYTNSGAAFGLFQDAGPLIVIISVLGMAAIAVYFLNPGFADPIMRLGLTLMLAGAIGNFIGRVGAGEVVDWIKLDFWPAFNIADSAISIGVVCLLWAIYRESTESPTIEG